MTKNVTLEIINRLFEIANLIDEDPKAFERMKDNSISIDLAGRYEFTIKEKSQ